MDPGILVPPVGYGGHERLVEMFALEYCRLGHHVDLLVTKGSKVEGCFVHGYGKVGFPPTNWQRIKAIVYVWMFLFKNKSSYDLVHNFGRLAFLFPILNKPVKKIMTYGRKINATNIESVNRIKSNNVFFTAPSVYCMNTGGVIGNWSVVYNAIDFTKYTLSMVDGDSAPMIFLGRLEYLKGAHEAIEISKKTGFKLIIAGNISNIPEEIEYFKRQIEPHIDGDLIKYVGPVNDLQKNYYLGLAKVLLFPARTDEAFGMVMVEAMACGTPVLAYNHSAMPEIIESGITGFLVEDLKEMIEVLDQIEFIDRKLCRIHAENRFDVKAVTQEYLKLVK